MKIEYQQQQETAPAPTPVIFTDVPQVEITDTRTIASPPAETSFGYKIAFGLFAAAHIVAVVLVIIGMYISLSGSTLPTERHLLPIHIVSSIINIITLILLGALLANAFTLAFVNLQRSYLQMASIAYVVLIVINLVLTLGTCVWNAYALDRTYTGRFSLELGLSIAIAVFGLLVCLGCFIGPCLIVGIVHLVHVRKQQ